MRILLATDGSDAARIPEILLTKVPRWKSAKIDVVTVAAIPLAGAIAGMPGEVDYSEQTQEAWRANKARCEEISARVAARLREAGLQAEGRCLDGDASGVLLDLLKTESHDMIAIGSKGESAVEGFFLGSVARKLLNQSPASVLVGRSSGQAHESGQALSAKSKLTVVVGADGSKGSDAAVHALTGMGDAAFAKVIALAVEPLSALPPDLDPEAFSELYQVDHEQALKLAQTTANYLVRTGDDVEGATRFGKSSVKIIEVATEQGADLIALGATKHGFIERLFLGSVSYEVATHAPCSVLVVRVTA